MNVKGVAVKTLIQFIRDRFGDEGVQKWVESLTDEAKELYKSTILPSAWYPLRSSISEPTKKICELFYNGNMKGAYESGEYSAEEGLSGVYKMYLKVGNPHYIIEKASTILPKYYDPSEIKVVDSQEKSFTIHVTKFAEIDEVIEHRIAGWINKAIVMSSCENVQSVIKKSMAKGDIVTEIVTTWD